MGFLSSIKTIAVTYDLQEVSDPLFVVDQIKGEIQMYLAYKHSPMRGQIQLSAPSRGITDHFFCFTCDECTIRTQLEKTLIEPM